MKKSLVLLSVLFLFAMGAMTTVHAWRRGPGSMMGYGSDCYGAGVLANPNLNLTEEQAARIRALDEKYLGEIKPIQDQFYDKRGELKLEWLQRTPDHSKINALQQEVTNLRNQMREKMTGHRLDVLKILTREQQAIMQDYRPGRGFHKRAGSDRWQ